MFCVIFPAFSACPLLPTVPYLILPSPPIHSLLPSSSSLHLLGQSSPAPTISKQPRLPNSALSSRRGPELVASQCIMQPCSAYLIFKPQSPQSPTPPSLPPAVGITIFPPTFSLSVSPLSTFQTHVEIFPGPGPCRESAPTSLTLK